MYLVEHSVEKSIYEISVDRRMAHIARSESEVNSATTDLKVLERQIEAANTSELQEASLSKLFAKGSGSGEMVDNELLWDCLFRQKPLTGDQLSAEANSEVSRYLRATAAEERRVEADNTMTEG